MLVQDKGARLEPGAAHRVYCARCAVHVHDPHSLTKRVLMAPKTWRLLCDVVDDKTVTATVSAVLSGSDA